MVGCGRCSMNRVLCFPEARKPGLVARESKDECTGDGVHNVSDTQRFHTNETLQRRSVSRKLLFLPGRQHGC